MARAIIGLLLLASASFAEEVVLVRSGRPETAIVLPKDPIPAEERGAREIRDHFKEMSGAELEIVTSIPPGERAVIRLMHDKALDPEEYRIKMDGRNLLIAGGRPRGVMYGCTALLEHFGVRWFTASLKVVPRREMISLTDLDKRGAPAFEYRHLYFTESDDPDWAARNRINGASKKLNASHGGSVLIQPFVHSLEQIVPGELFETHSEYFPEVNGIRSPGVVKGGKVYAAAVQRCLSNREVVELAVAKVEEWKRESPEAQMISASQNDGGWCSCGACQSLDVKHGGKAGVMIWFANQVAEAHPDRTIDTLAYGETQHPPKDIVPLKNVRICPIKVCHAHPLAKCKFAESMAFLKHLKGWNAITDSLNVWHYNAAFANQLMPFPDFRSFPEDLRLYRHHDVRGVFFQGAHSPGGGGADADLRAWVMAPLLWDPAQDSDALVEEWMKGVFGNAWAPMKDWFDRQHREIDDPFRHLYISDSPLHVAFSESLIDAGDALFNKAEKAATGKAAAAVAKARLSLRFVKLERSKVPSADLEPFLEDARRFGVTDVADGRTLEDWAAEIRKRKR